MSVTWDLGSSYCLPISSYYGPNSIKELTLQESNHEIIVIGKHCLHSGHVSEGLTLILNSAACSSCFGPGGLRDAEPAESPHRRYTGLRQRDVLGREGARRRLGEGWHRNRRGSPLFTPNAIVVQSKSAFPSAIHHLNALRDH